MTTTAGIPSFTPTSRPSSQDLSNQALTKGRREDKQEANQRQLKRLRLTPSPEESRGVKKRRISSTAARAHDPGAASRRDGRCVGSRASSSAARVYDPGAAGRRLSGQKRSSTATSSTSTQALGAESRAGRLSLKKRGRGAPAASE